MSAWLTRNEAMEKGRRVSNAFLVAPPGRKPTSRCCREAYLEGLGRQRYIVHGVRGRQAVMMARMEVILLDGEQNCSPMAPDTDTAGGRPR